jgi:putative endonuclease
VEETNGLEKSKVEYATYMFTVYILKTSGNTLYIGQTKDLNKRLEIHRQKSVKSAKYLKYFESFCVVYTENYETRSEAMKREYQLKQLTKNQKEELIKSAQSSILFKPSTS